MYPLYDNPDRKDWLAFRNEIKQLFHVSGVELVAAYSCLFHLSGPVRVVAFSCFEKGFSTIALSGIEGNNTNTSIHVPLPAC